MQQFLGCIFLLLNWVTIVRGRMRWDDERLNAYSWIQTCGKESSFSLGENLMYAAGTYKLTHEVGADKRYVTCEKPTFWAATSLFYRLLSLPSEETARSAHPLSRISTFFSSSASRTEIGSIRFSGLHVNSSPFNQQYRLGVAS